MTLRRGNIILVQMHFHQASGSKIRPAAVILDNTDDDFVAAPVTSQYRSTPYDVAIDDWRAAGLNVPSSIRVHKVAVLSKRNIIRTIGTLANADIESLNATLCAAFCPAAIAADLMPET